MESIMRQIVKEEVSKQLTASSVKDRNENVPDKSATFNKSGNGHGSSEGKHNRNANLSTRLNDQ